MVSLESPASQLSVDTKNTQIDAFTMTKYQILEQAFLADPDVTDLQVLTRRISCGLAFFKVIVHACMWYRRIGLLEIY